MNEVVCICMDGYSGANCSMMVYVPQDDCLPNPCIHGICNDESNGFTCICDTGYEGPTCAIGMMEEMPSQMVEMQFSRINLIFTVMPGLCWY